MTDSRVCVVTGARGLLGKAVCRALSERGWLVAALDLHLDRYAIDEPRIVHYGADVTVERELRQVLDMMLGLWCAPYALVNCAGIDAKPGSPGTRPFEDFDLDDWNRVVGVNLTGTALCCKVFGSVFASLRRGSIVNVASLYAVVGPDQRLYQDGFTKPAAYSASKAGVLGLTRYLAAYWGDRQVRVNAVTLGGVLQTSTPAAFSQAYEQKVPLGRMARPDDFVGAVAYLVGDEAKYVTGHNLAVDGGYTAL